MAKRSPQEDYQLQFTPGQAVTFDYGAFDDLILYHGVTFVHFRAMRCPIGMVDKYDVRKPDNCELECSNGFIYTEAKHITGVFTNSPVRENGQDYGWLDENTAQLTIPITYDNCDEKIHITRYDRLYLCEDTITVQNWELIEAHATGIDRLSFPAVNVIDLIDNRGIKYSSSDYTVTKGKIHWIGQKQPGQDPSTGKGRIYSIRYDYRPYWLVKSLPHEIRVSQENTDTGREVSQLPQLLALQREYVRTSETAKDGVDNERALPSPRDGGFGPR